MDDILVSVWCITYNHEPYIADAIEGVLAQKTDFNYEMVIHDDASTDRTAEIIRTYEQKYPQQIHGIYQKENMFQKNNGIQQWIWSVMTERCKGKYIAFCEGDDYWTDVHKLRIQTEYLETHPDCAIVVHDAIKMDEERHDEKPVNLYDRDQTVPAEDIILQRPSAIPTASIVCRRELVYMEEFFKNVGVGDYPFLLYGLTKGRVWYINRIMSVYRYCHAGSWTGSILRDDKKHMIHNAEIICFLQIYKNYMINMPGIEDQNQAECAVVSKIQMHVDHMMFLCKKQGKEHDPDIYRDYDRITEGRFHQLFNRMEELWRQANEESYMNEKVRTFAHSFSKIVIMGAGQYAGMIAKQLAYHNIRWEGFAVSDIRQTSGRYSGRPVWKLSQIPFRQQETGIIVGINPADWTQIRTALSYAGIENYICPFLLD